MGRRTLDRVGEPPLRRVQVYLSEGEARALEGLLRPLGVGASRRGAWRLSWALADLGRLICLGAATPDARGDARARELPRVAGRRRNVQVFLSDREIEALRLVATLDAGVVARLGSWSGAAREVGDLLRRIAVGRAPLRAGPAAGLVAAWRVRATINPVGAWIRIQARLEGARGWATSRGVALVRDLENGAIPVPEALTALVAAPIDPSSGRDPRALAPILRAAIEHEAHERATGS